MEDNPRYTFVKGAIRDRELVGQLFARYAFDTVVNFAAESHVDRSITQPEIFLTTNIVGTRPCWTRPRGPGSWPRRTSTPGSSDRG